MAGKKIYVSVSRVVLKTASLRQLAIASVDEQLGHDAFGHAVTAAR